AILILLALTLAGPHPVRGLTARSPRMMLAWATIASALLLAVDMTAIDRIVHWYSDAVDGGSFASLLLMAELADVGLWAPPWILASGGAVLAGAVRLCVVRASGLDPAVSASLLIAGCLLLAPGLVPWDSLWLLPVAALASRRWWVLIVWTVAEAV